MDSDFVCHSVWFEFFFKAKVKRESPADFNGRPSFAAETVFASTSCHWRYEAACNLLHPVASFPDSAHSKTLLVIIEYLPY